MLAPSLSVMFVGQDEHRELREVAAHLREAVGRYWPVADPRAAVALLRDGRYRPDLIVLAPLWPGQFADEHVGEMLQQYPLARVIRCLTTWCQGGGRGAVRGVGHVCVAYPGAVMRLTSELALLQHHTLPALGLPATAGAEEQLDRALATAAIRDPERSEAKALASVAVACGEPELAAVLAEACQPLAQRVCVGTMDQLRRVTADCLLWDATPWSQRRCAELAAYRDAHPGVAVIALSDFPRPELCDQLLGAGASAVLTKPLLLSDLAWQLEQVAARAG